MFALYIKGEKIREYPKRKHKEAFRDLIKAQRFDHIGESSKLYTIFDGKHILKCVYSYEAGDKVEAEIKEERIDQLLTKEIK
jgi:hypothetical protein